MLNVPYPAPTNVKETWMAPFYLLSNPRDCPTLPSLYSLTCHHWISCHLSYVFSFVTAMCKIKLPNCYSPERSQSFETLLPALAPKSSLTINSLNLSSGLEFLLSTHSKVSYNALRFTVRECSPGVGELRRWWYANTRVSSLNTMVKTQERNSHRIAGRWDKGSSPVMEKGSTAAQDRMDGILVGHDYSILISLWNRSWKPSLKVCLEILAPQHENENMFWNQSNLGYNSVSAIRGCITLDKTTHLFFLI